LPLVAEGFDLASLHFPASSGGIAVDTAAELLFQVIAGRAERAAVIVTTNLLCGAPHNRFNAECIFMRSRRPQK
jgi:hypothetical protein